MRRRWLIPLVVALAIAVVSAAYWVGRWPITDDQRYAELQRWGIDYRRARTIRPGFPAALAALVHFTSVTNYLRNRFEQQERALVSSGYLVEVTLSVPDLQTNRNQVRTLLSNVWARTGAYYVAKLDRSRNEVRLLCRKKDVAMWQAAFDNLQRGSLDACVRAH